MRVAQASSLLITDISRLEACATNWVFTPENKKRLDLGTREISSRLFSAIPFQQAGSLRY